MTERMCRKEIFRDGDYNFEKDPSVEDPEQLKMWRLEGEAGMTRIETLNSIVHLLLIIRPCAVWLF